MILESGQPGFEIQPVILYNMYFFSSSTLVVGEMLTMIMLGKDYQK